MLLLGDLKAFRVLSANTSVPQHDHKSVGRLFLNVLLMFFIFLCWFVKPLQVQGRVLRQLFFCRLITEEVFGSGSAVSSLSSPPPLLCLRLIFIKFFRFCSKLEGSGGMWGLWNVAAEWRWLNSPELSETLNAWRQEDVSSQLCVSECCFDKTMSTLN